MVGYDGSPLSPQAQQRLAGASLVVGGARNLEPVDGGRQFVMGDVSAALDEVQATDGDTVVMASGDPALFGILRVMRERGMRPEVLPAVSSIAVAFARIGLPWDDAAALSVHGRDPRHAVNACRALPKTAVLTSPRFGPAELGRALTGWHRELVVASRLGMPDELIIRCTPAEAAEGDWADPNVVLVLDDRRLGGGVRADNQPAAPPQGWAHPDAGYRHRDGMVTKWEVRALVLARLQPTLGALIWDVGSGSGSVAIECNAHRAAVIAIESDPAACAQIRANVETHGADVRLVVGRAPEVFPDLPDPDAVFVGGGGLAALTGALQREPAVVVATYAALDRAVSARRALTDAGYSVDGVQLAASRFADLPGDSFRLAAQNPVLVLWGAK